MSEDFIRALFARRLAYRQFMRKYAVRDLSLIPTGRVVNGVYVEVKRVAL